MDPVFYIRQKTDVKFKFSFSGPLGNNNYRDFLTSFTPPSNYVPDTQYITKFKQLLQSYGDNCLEKFIENIKTQRQNYIRDNGVAKFISFNISDVINRAFQWSETPEEHNYWSNLNSRYTRDIRRLL